MGYAPPPFPLSLIRNVERHIKIQHRIDMFIYRTIIKRYFFIIPLLVILLITIGCNSPNDPRVEASCTQHGGALRVTTIGCGFGCLQKVIICKDGFTIPW